MKKGILLASLSIVVLICIISFLKPTVTDQNTEDRQQAVATLSESNPETSQVKLNSENMTVHSEHNQESSSNSKEQLFDTKSDLSIQPIDPETDTGNQIVHPN